MTEQDRHNRNQSKLAECWPAFANKIKAVLQDLEGHGLRPRIQEAWRSPEDQLVAFHSGHSKLQFGFHNVTGASNKPEALAVDILDDDHPNQESTKFLLMLAASAKSHNLTTGIMWGLPNPLADATLRAFSQQKWDAPVKVGWDPCHVQPQGITPQQAKGGQRI